MFVHKCVLRRMTLPLLPCDCTVCDWYVCNSRYNRCFWVLAEQLEFTGAKLSFQEIAEIEGLSIEEITKIYESAIFKLRQGSNTLTKTEEYDNIS